MTSLSERRPAAVPHRARTLSQPRLHELVVEELTTSIVQGTFPPHTALPTETELAERFEVSRMVIREAVRLLGSKGLVKVRQGSGVWVQPPDAWDHLDPVILANRLEAGQDESLLDQLLEVRRIVEVEAAGLAAARRTAEDLVTLRDTIALLRAAIATGKLEDLGPLDLRYHEALFRASGNIVLRQMVWTVATLFRTAGHVHRNGIPRIEESHRGHEAILAAIENGDADGARSAMLHHINQASEDIRRSMRAQWSGDERATEGADRTGLDGD